MQHVSNQFFDVAPRFLCNRNSLEKKNFIKMMHLILNLNNDITRINFIRNLKIQDPRYFLMEYIYIYISQVNIRLEIIPTAREDSTSQCISFLKFSHLCNSINLASMPDIKSSFSTYVLH